MSRKELEALLAAPALQPPPGAEASFDNPPNRNGLAWFVTTLLLMFGAYGAFWGTAYAGYAMILAPGYYVHQWHLRNADLVRPLYLILVYGCCYSVVLPLIKTAILLDWSRVFVPSDKRRSPLWWGCIVLGGLQCVWGITCIILLNMQCIPHRAIWEFYVPSKCYNLPSVMLGSATVQVVTDVAMVLLPQRTIWALNMNWQKKLGVACIAAGFRLSHTVTFSQEADRMYYIGPLLFWAWAEMTAGFFILSVPCLPKLVIESRLPTRIKVALGLSVQTNPPIGGSNDLVTIGGSGGTRRKPLPKDSLTLRDSYYEIGDDDIHRSDTGRPESQERLRERPDTGSNKASGIAAMSGSHSGSDTEENPSIRLR
uniref:Rhodopsin domain-containing protein n=1 Tax=Fusarium oxysporum (strain Fo5176) TaxID=660025 RepID=A0A0D2YKD9_FUSOF